MDNGRTATRLVLAAGIAAGLVHAVTFPRLKPAQVAVATDVYHHAARAALAGGDLYAVTPPDHPGFRFLYPPVVAVLFLPYGPLGAAGAYAVQTALNLASLLALGVVLARTAGAFVSLEPIDRVLIVGYTVASVPAVTNTVMGQVNPQLAVGLAGVVLLAEQNRTAAAGALLAAVATVKLFLAPVGVWLLRRRPSPAVGGAVVTGLGLAAVGLLALGPEATVTYLIETLPREATTRPFADGPDPEAPYLTVRRQLAVLAPGLPDAARLPVAAAAVAPVVVAATRASGDRRVDLAAVQVVVLAVLVLFPLEPFYLVLATFPLLALVYAVDGVPRALLLGGVVAFSVPVSLGTLETWLSLLGISGSFGQIALAVLEYAFAFALPAMVGVWAVVAGCLHYQYRAV